MKSKIYEFNPVLYPFSIHISMDFDVEELKSIYKTMNVSEEEEPITDEFDAKETTTARTILVVDSKGGSMHFLVLLFSPKNIGAGICAHEAVHLANSYLQYLGFSSPAAYNDEPYAYFVQWVTNCIWSVLVDKPEDMRGVLLQKDNKEE